jgi:hypothetical protein
VLDRAYGDHYGFLARNWIDFKNTPSFVAGLGVGTYDGVVGMPAALGATATAVWTWATTSAPPRDLVAERAQRIADRDAELSHELLRINDGAAANYEDGVWYGDKVLAGVVVGEGIGVAFKGAVGAGALVRTTETAEVAAADGSTFAARVTVVEGTPDAVAGAAPRLTDAQRLRGKVATTPDGSSVLGPESAVAGRGVNFTSDNALIVGDPNAFVIGVHATRDSLSFYADVEGAVALSPRSVAVRMWRSGYRGGDIKLVACECGANPGLVTGLRRELNALELTSPVGTITAPTATVNGMGKLTAEGTWVEFRP